MAAGNYNFTIEQGTTFIRTFKYKDATGDPNRIDAPDFKSKSVRVILSSSLIEDGGFEINADAPPLIKKITKSSSVDDDI